jgi:hypothetical protein
VRGPRVGGPARNLVIAEVSGRRAAVLARPLELLGRRVTQLRRLFESLAHGLKLTSIQSGATLTSHRAPSRRSA